MRISRLRNGVTKSRLGLSRALEGHRRAHTILNGVLGNHLKVNGMDLFCFPSKNARNFELGVKHRLWAVGTVLNHSSMAARVTKANRFLHVGACGLLYCNPTHSFTVPFIVRSRADSVRVVTDVWPEPWRLPFDIEPLGDLSRQLSAEGARKRWPFLEERVGPRGGVSAALNFTGVTVFVPVAITTDDWALICRDLATTRR